MFDHSRRIPPKISGETAHSYHLIRRNCRVSGPFHEPLILRYRATNRLARAIPKFLRFKDPRRKSVLLRRVVPGTLPGTTTFILIDDPIAVWDPTVFVDSTTRWARVACKMLSVKCRDEAYNVQFARELMVGAIALVLFFVSPFYFHGFPCRAGNAAEKQVGSAQVRGRSRGGTLCQCPICIDNHRPATNTVHVFTYCDPARKYMQISATDSRVEVIPIRSLTVPRD